MIRVTALLAAHNRVAKTRTCIASLLAQVGHGKDFHLSIVLVDDGSTDGTA